MTTPISNQPRAENLTSYDIQTTNSNESGSIYSGKAEKTASTVDEEIHMVAVGYNLGPVSLQAQYKDVANHANTTNADGTIVGVYLGTRF